ncbi:MAG: sulfate ABC transporter substrate-binding protein [Kingella sp. (in: b-proteobacteria)]
MWKKSIATLMTAVLLASCGGQNASDNQTTASSGNQNNKNAIELLNVSYDVMRDFYKDYNPLFIKHFQAANPNTTINIQQSHGGSSKQALSVANGLQADVVTMNQSSDIELLQKKGLVANDWQTVLPNNAVPFTSITVLLVRKGNPKNIKGWEDLARDGIQSVIANPKTSGNGRYAFLGAYANALKQNNNNHEAAKAFTKKVFANVAVLDAGGRGATTTFAQRGIGDVLVTFENEAQVVLKQFEKDGLEIIYPNYTIAAENPVAVVKTVTDKKGTTAAATEYLNYLWSDEGQELAAQLYLRPSKPEILAKHHDRFPKVEAFRANDVFGSWDEIMKTYFADGGVFDQINKR